MRLGLHFATMQTKLLIHHILTRYRVEVEPGYTPAWQPWPIPEPRDGLQCGASCGSDGSQGRHRLPARQRARRLAANTTG
jgi:hypothetical protein